MMIFPAGLEARWDNVAHMACAAACYQQALLLEMMFLIYHCWATIDTAAAAVVSVGTISSKMTLMASL